MRSRTKAWRVALLVLGSLLVVTSAASARTCPNGKDSNGPMWLSIVHPGLGEWALNGWGPFSQNAPQRKFWMGFIPGFGFPYLHVVSAIDVSKCRTDDGLNID